MHSNTKYLLKKYVGIPYKAGGMDLNGFDCFGLIRSVVKEFKLPFPDEYTWTDHAWQSGIDDLIKQSRMIKAKTYKLGDLLAIKLEGKISHCGVFIGDRYFLQTFKTTGCVAVKVNNSKWERRIVATYRMLKD